MAEPSRPPRECERIISMLSDFIDGDISPSNRWSVRLHLDACLGCTQLAAELVATVAALHRLARPQAVTGVRRGASSEPS